MYAVIDQQGRGYITADTFDDAEKMRALLFKIFELTGTDISVLGIAVTEGEE